MKFRYLVYLFPLLFCCCKKNHSQATINTGSFTFTAQYDSVITWYANSSYNFTFNINVLTGEIESDPLYCYMKQLPANVSVSPDTIRVDQLLGGVFTFTIGNVPVGTDTMHFVINSNAYGTQTHNLILKIVNQFPVLTGTYDSCYDFCGATKYSYSSIVSAVADTPSELKITNVRGLGGSFVVTALLSSIVTIPLQTVDSLTIWGAGTYTLDNRPAYSSLYVMIINDTLVQGIDTEACTIHIQH